MLREGQAVINDLRGEAEGVVGQLNETKEQLFGLISWAKNLWASLTSAPRAAADIEVAPEVVAAPKPVAKKANRKSPEPEPDADLLQMQVVHEVSQQLGRFFDIQHKIITHYKNLEDESMHVYEAEQNHAMKAIERVEVELQLEELTKKIRETMVYAPPELKDLYTRFLAMYGRIKDEQEFARLEQLQQARNERARAWQLRNNQIDCWLQTVGVALGVIWIWAFLGGIVWLREMRAAFWLD